MNKLRHIYYIAIERIGLLLVRLGAFLKQMFRIQVSQNGFWRDVEGVGNLDGRETEVAGEDERSQPSVGNLVRKNFLLSPEVFFQLDDNDFGVRERPGGSRPPPPSG